jgi:hypothetical protein
VKVLRKSLAAAVEAIAECVEFILAHAGKEPRVAFAGAVPFLKLVGITCGGWQMGRAALVSEAKLAAQEGDAKFYSAKIATARFFGDHVLSQAKGLRDAVVNGSDTVMALDEEQFLAA